MIIYDGRMDKSGSGQQQQKIVDHPTQLIDIYPTIMSLAQVDQLPHALDGYSLVPFLHNEKKKQQQDRPNFVVSQYHGDDVAMSWFMIVEAIGQVAMKLIVWGTGEEHAHQLFDLTNDPDELNDLIHDASYAGIVDQLDRNLRSVVDYPAVAIEVAQYNRDSMMQWIQTTPDWMSVIRSSRIRWTKSWEQNSDDAFAALQEWLDGGAGPLRQCRRELLWPTPPLAHSHEESSTPGVAVS